MGKKAKRDRGYGLKRKLGIQTNHFRHLASGIPWCPLCQREGRC